MDDFLDEKQKKAKELQDKAKIEQNMAFIGNEVPLVWHTIYKTLLNDGVVPRLAEQMVIAYIIGSVCNSGIRIIE